MGECSDCGDDSSFGYTCKRCGRTFCVSHRLPEKHACIGARAEEIGRTLAEHSDGEASPHTTANSPKPMELTESHRVGAGPDVSDIGERGPDVNLDGSIKQADDDEEVDVAAEGEGGGVVARIRALVPF